MRPHIQYGVEVHRSFRAGSVQPTRHISYLVPSRADAFWTASDFELACDFEALAVETDDGECIVHHALRQQGLAVTAPGYGPRPLPDFSSMHLQTEVGTLSEGIAFSPDGRYVYVANWGEQNLVPYQLQGDKLVAVGTPLKLPGHPVSMRSSTP